MDTEEFIKPFRIYKDSQIIDISSQTGYKYSEFNEEAELISSEIKTLAIPLYSIVLIYKVSSTINSLLFFYASLKSGFIPFIVETEEIEDLEDLKYSAVICDYELNNITHNSVKQVIYRGNIYYKCNEECFLGTEEDFIVATSSKSTSSVSKKILLGKKQTLFNIKSNINSLSIKHSDKTLILLPLSYCYGLIAQFLSHISVGADIFIAPKVVGVIQLQTLLIKFKISTLFLTPLLARLVLIYNKTPINNVLRYATLGGDKPSASTILKIQNLLDCTIFGTYGLGEAGPRVATNKFNSDHIKNNKISLGNLNTGIHATIIPNQEYEAKTNISGVGYLKIFTQSVYIGYIEGNKLIRPESNEYIITKDIVYKQNNEYYLLGRENEYIVKNNKLYWFQEFKSHFYNNPNILKVIIKKQMNYILDITVFYKCLHDITLEIEDSFLSKYKLEKDIDYKLHIIKYQYNQYK